jgi:large subunit ribosomal protein L4
MPVVDVLNIDARKIGEITLRDDVFSVEPKLHLISLILRQQFASMRQGTACTKTRTEVRASSKKPWRQKGTGRARSGDRSSPLWRGGGVTFGPKPQRFVLKVPQKAKKAALRSAFSLKYKDNKLTILDGFELPEIRTRLFVEHKNKLNLNKALIVIDAQNENLQKSAHNVPNVKVLLSAGLNLFDILRYDHLVLTRGAVDYIEKVYGK